MCLGEESELPLLEDLDFFCFGDEDLPFLRDPDQLFLQIKSAVFSSNVDDPNLSCLGDSFDFL